MSGGGGGGDAPGALPMSWKVIGADEGVEDPAEWVELTTLAGSSRLEVRAHDWLDESEVYLDVVGVRRLIEHLGSALAVMERATP